MILKSEPEFISWPYVMLTRELLKNLAFWCSLRWWRVSRDAAMSRPRRQLSRTATTIRPQRQIKSDPTTSRPRWIRLSRRCRRWRWTRLNEEKERERKNLIIVGLSRKPEQRWSIHRAMSAIKLERDDGYAKRCHAAPAIKPKCDDWYAEKATCRVGD